MNKKGYMALALDNPDKVSSFHTSLREANQEAQQYGVCWVVCSANLVYDSELKSDRAYDNYLLRKLEGRVKVYTVPFDGFGERDVFVYKGGNAKGWKPSTKKFRKEVMVYLAGHPRTELCLPDGNGVTLVRCDRPGVISRDLGIEVAGGGKAIKRAGQVLRKYYKLMEYGKEDLGFEVLDNEDVEAVMDGYIGMPLSMLKDEEKGKVYNGRLFVPGGVLAEFPEGCLVKGQVFFSDRFTKVTFHRCNCKTELRIRKDQPIRIGLTPQEGKLRGRISDQMFLSQPGLLLPETRKEDVTAYYERQRRDFESGRTEVRLEELYESMDNGRVEEGCRYIGVSELISRALKRIDMKYVPKGLMEEYLLGKGKAMLNPLTFKMKVPHGWQTHCQVVTDAWMGFVKPHYLKEQGLVRIPRGCLVYDPEYKVYVVGDEDFTERFPLDHGGPDGDDFYDQIFRRTEDGFIKVLLFRSPVGWGEWSQWEFVGKLPWPERREEYVPLLEEGEHQLSTPRSQVVGPRRPNGLRKGNKIDWTKRYGIDSFKKILFASEGGVGSLINKMSLLNMLRFSELGRIEDDTSFKFSIEECIDTYTQCTNAENLAVMTRFELAVDGWLQKLADEGREFSNRFVTGRSIDTTARLTDSDIYSQVVKHGLKERDSWEEWVEGRMKTFFSGHQGVIEKDPEVVKKSRHWQQAEKLLYCFDCVMGNEEVDKVEGKVSDAGWQTLAEKRKALIEDWKGSSLEEMMPFLIWEVYVNPSPRKERHDRIFQEPQVLEAYCDYVVAHLMPDKSEVMDHEYDCV